MLSMLATLAMSISISGWLYFGRTLNLWILTPVGVMIGGSIYFAALWVRA
jgi:hypothetical protein